MQANLSTLLCRLLDNCIVGKERRIVEPPCQCPFSAVTADGWRTAVGQRHFGDALPKSRTDPFSTGYEGQLASTAAVPRSMYQQRRIRWCPYPCGMTTRTTRTKRNDNRKEQKQTISCWFGSATVAPVCASCKFNLVSVCKIKIKASKEQLNHFLSSNHMSTILLF